MKVQSILGKTKKRVSMSLNKLNKTKTRFVDYLQWAYMETYYKQINEEDRIEYAIVTHKCGSLQMCFGFRGFDLDSENKAIVAGVYNAFNNQIKKLGTGWMVSVEAQRFESDEYPYIHRDNLACLLIEKERRALFQKSGSHFEGRYFINIVYTPEPEFKKNMVNVFYDRVTEVTNQAEYDIQEFVKKNFDITAALQYHLIIRPLTGIETLQYLHSTMSFTKIEYNYEHTIFIDRLFDDAHLVVGNPCVLDGKYIPIIQVNDFPMWAYPGIFNALLKLEIEYRWVTRANMLDREDANQELQKSQERWSRQRKNSKQLMKEIMFKTQTTNENIGAIAQENDSAEVLGEVTQNLVGLCKYSTMVMVWDDTLIGAQRKVEKIKSAIIACGFSCREEENNAYEAFLSMTAGNIYANLRRDLVTTGNAAYTLPLNAVWNGIKESNFMKEITGVDVPLLTCQTDYGDLFYFQLAVRGVMHFAIFGPTGAGKSILLITLAYAFTKYTDSQVIIFDKDASAITATLAVGGEFYEPGNPLAMAFQPLADIDDPQELAWAHEFIVLLFELAGISLFPDQEEEITNALKRTATYAKELRTMTTFSSNCQILDREGREISRSVLLPYTVAGLYGSIFDGTNFKLSQNRWLMVEMGAIMQRGPKVLDPALFYLFHTIEKRFDGRPTLFAMDEVWQFLENDKFASKIKEWLKVLRKKNVGVGFATQNLTDAVESKIFYTILENCPTKIFLPNSNAISTSDTYRLFSLQDEDIQIIQNAYPQKEYFYYSIEGKRKFQLNLNILQLALSVKLPEKEIKKYLMLRRELGEEYGYKGFVENILIARKVPYLQYLEDEEYESFIVEEVKDDA